MEISNQVAKLDLKNLGESGLLIPHGKRRGRYYSASKQLQEIYKEVLLPKSNLDPFEEI